MVSFSANFRSIEPQFRFEGGFCGCFDIQGQLIWFLMFESIVFEGRFDWICMFGSLHSNSSSGLAVVDGFEFFF